MIKVGPSPGITLATADLDISEPHKGVESHQQLLPRREWRAYSTTGRGEAGRWEGVFVLGVH